MGDCGVFGGEANGDVLSPGLGPDPPTIEEENWTVAEEAAQELLNWIHPTLDSEERRKDVIDYVQRLIRDSIGCEVFPYGSVPLKTYLPDGDIDLTALSGSNLEELLPQEVLAVLQEEEQNENAEYQVKDTQFIDAEVKLVKCLVRDIVVDISFNQLGGLCTLCFLEQVDRLVAKNHLFKRSILLVKAWCYYESRILGAHHGLISTYALETLVLYIFHVFHSSLNGPLMVLYRFLDYFSKFDWDNYCISINGPVRKSALPNIVVEMPDNGGNDLMLSEEFLRNCMEMFSVPSRGSDTSPQTFPPKHLNIIDPLKDHNNLGRSVHRGNFYRIRSAFKYGARKLGRVLSLPRDRIRDEMKDFYANTLERHGHRNGSDLQKPGLVFGADGYLNLSSSSFDEVLDEDNMLLRSQSADFQKNNIVREDNYTVVFSDGLGKCLPRVGVSEGCYLADGSTVSRHRLHGDAYDLSSVSSLRSTDGSSDCLSTHDSSLSGKRLSHLCSSKCSIENGNLKVESFSRTDTCDGIDEKVEFDVLLEQTENGFVTNTYALCMDKYEDICSKGSGISTPKTETLETLSLDFRERDFDNLAGDAEPLNPLSDLSGDYDSHIRSLLYGQCIHGFTLCAPVGSNPPTSPSRFRSKKPWDTVRQSMPLRHNSFSQMNSNSLYSEPPLAGANFAPSGAVLDSEDKHKARGTGTYLPNTYCFCRERWRKGGRPRNKISGSSCQLQRRTRKNGLSPVLLETSSCENGSYDEVPNSRATVLGHHKSDVTTQTNCNVGVDSDISGFSNAPCSLEFGSLGNLPEILLSASSRNAQGSLSVKGNIFKPGQDKRERVAEQSFHLKNEDEFPPLSV